AAANLRSLISDNPEMIGTRYADRLLPGPERMQAIVDHLVGQEKTAVGALGHESALLVAYVGYQQNDPKLIDRGLEDFAKRIPQDPAGDKDRTLLALLKGVWAAK